MAVSEDGFVLGFGREAQDLLKKDKCVRLMAFTGIHFISPSALSGAAAGVQADILDIYRSLITRGACPRAITEQGLFWREMGSVESYSRLTGELPQLEPGRLLPLRTGEHITLDPQTIMHPDCTLKGSVVAGRDVQICEGVSLENVILWDDIRIEKGSSLTDCIVADGMSIAGRHSGKIFARAVQPDEILLPCQ